MKEFVAPEMEIVMFEAVDIITASDLNNPGDGMGWG